MLFMHIIGMVLIVLVLGGLAVTIVGMLIYRIAWPIYRAVALTYTVFPMKGVVIGKKSDDNMWMQIATHTYPLGLYDDYYVYIWVDGKKIEIENSTLYDKVKVGEVVHVDIHRGYNKKGKMCDEYYDVK